MATITIRDEEILAVLDKTPMTAAQLLAVSDIFRNGRFTNERKVRARLQKLCAGPVKQARYGGLAGRIGSPAYYLLTPLGFRMLHGNDARPHSKYAFKEIGIARQRHTYALAEFIIATLRSAHAFQIPVLDFFRENTLRLQVGRERLMPDCAFSLMQDGREYHYVVEIDCGSEPIRSVRSVHAWQRKVDLYETLAATAAQRFRVLVLTTQQHRRLDAILALAAKASKNPQRRLFLAASLDDYLGRRLPLFERLFRDHQQEPASLLHSMPDAAAQAEVPAVQPEPVIP